MQAMDPMITPKIKAAMILRGSCLLTYIGCYLVLWEGKSRKTICVKNDHG